MANIKFDFGAVYDSSQKVKDIADRMEQEGNKIKSIISSVEYSWIGTGSAEYVRYLEGVQSDISKRAQRLNEIADMLSVSAKEAEIADRAAAEAISGANTPAGMSDRVIDGGGNQRILRTSGEGGMGIYNSQGGLFESFRQGAEYFTHGENPGEECTSTALAQCSTINGISKRANDYNDYNGRTQIAGYRASSEQVTQFCVENLKKGTATVIYYNYDGGNDFGSNGHAVTVVGSNPYASSVYDLNIIDPADGQYKNFGQAFGSKNGNFYICYEANPDQYGGAATKYNDIANFLNNR